MPGKRKIEDICQRAGMKPVHRATIRGHEIFIADGFSIMPHKPFQRFGIGKFDFPGGMYCTLWWASKGDERLDTGQPLFFDAFHDPSLSKGSKQRARINSALEAAREFIDSRRKKWH